MPSSSSPSSSHTLQVVLPETLSPPWSGSENPSTPGTWRACAGTRPSHPASVVWRGSQECESGAARPGPPHNLGPALGALSPEFLTAGGQQPAGG